MGDKTKERKNLIKEDDIDKLYRIKGANAYYVELLDGTALLRNYPTLPYLGSKEIISCPLTGIDLVFFELLFAYRGSLVSYSKIKRIVGTSSPKDTKGRINKSLKKLNVSSVLKNIGNYADETNGGYYLEDWFYECDEKGKIKDMEKLKSDFFENNTDYFSFSAYPDDLKIVGRAGEIKAIQRILAGNGRIITTFISGESGVGKSKLAYELFREYRKKDWNVLWIDRISCDPDIVIEKLQNIEGNVFIVIDDIQFCKDIFKRLIQFIISSKALEDSRIRILATTNETNPDQNYGFYKKYGVKITDYFLDKLEDKYLKIIISNYIRTRGKKEGKEIAYKEILKIQEKILAKLSELDITDSRPLYSLLMAEALYDGCIINDWNQRETLDYILEIDKRKLLLILEDYAPNVREKLLIAKSVEVLRAIANCVGGLSIDGTSEHDLINILYDNRVNIDDLKYIFSQLALLNENTRRIDCLYPDLVGQYYCLKVILNRDFLDTNQFNHVIRFILSQGKTASINYIDAMTNNWSEYEDEDDVSSFYAITQDPQYDEYRIDAMYHVISCQRDLYFELAEQAGRTVFEEDREHEHEIWGPLHKLVIPIYPIDDMELLEIKNRSSERVAQFFSTLDAISSAVDYKNNLSCIDPGGNVISYSGTLLWGCPHGEGCCEWDDGTVFKGGFYCGFLDGYGTFFHKDGRQYSCNISYGARSGKGTYIWPDGTRYDGYWAAGLRLGPGKMVFTDGTVLAGWWEADHYSRPFYPDYYEDWYMEFYDVSSTSDISMDNDYKVPPKKGCYFENLTEMGSIIHNYKTP